MKYLNFFENYSNINRDWKNEIKFLIHKIIKNGIDKSKVYDFLNNINKKSALIISGFPGIGKSYFFNLMKNSGKKILDSDSSLFSWIEKGVRHPDFPQNYINHIKKNMYDADIILVSSHKIVRDALVDNNIYFTLIYPDRSIKNEYINRYKSRGSDDSFVKLLEKNWDNFIDDCENQENCDKIIIKSGEYLCDKINELIN